MKAKEITWQSELFARMTANSNAIFTEYKTNSYTLIYINACVRCWLHEIEAYYNNNLISFFTANLLSTRIRVARSAYLSRINREEHARCIIL